MPSPASNGRLIIVSNRLPVSINRTNTQEYKCTPSSGGLVTGLGGLATCGVSFLWYGWSGLEIPLEDVAHMRERLSKQHNAVPVLLDQQVAEGYYDGFSNSTLWPLLHQQYDLVSLEDDTLSAYRKANETFADTIAGDMQDGDQIWIQDYHLMLLPQLIRQRADDLDISIRIGWFLHTPFPEEDALSLLPSGAEMLRGILGADVVGFQTDEARHNFLAASCQLLGAQLYATHEPSPGLSTVSGHPALHTKILCGGRETSVGVFPIGVEPSEFYARLRKESVQDMIRRMRQRLQGLKVIVGVDRLDIIKGLPHKLRAFDRFFEKYPEWVGKVMLVQLVIPSRANLGVNQRLRIEVQNLAASINDKHGSMGYLPVHLLYKSIPSEELTALYTAADVCFVSSLRDGMNLVSYEYVACHNEVAMQSSRCDIPHGALVLSQFAGAADILDGSMLVDPWDADHCAETLAYAVSMTVDEAQTRMKRLGAMVEQYTSSSWGTSFVRALEDDAGQHQKAEDRHLSRGVRDRRRSTNADRIRISSPDQQDSVSLADSQNSSPVSTASSSREPSLISDSSSVSESSWVSESSCAIKFSSFSELSKPNTHGLRCRPDRYSKLECDSCETRELCIDEGLDIPDVVDEKAEQTAKRKRESPWAWDRVVPRDVFGRSPAPEANGVVVGEVW